MSTPPLPAPIYAHFWMCWAGWGRQPPRARTDPDRRPHSPRDRSSTRAARWRSHRPGHWTFLHVNDSHLGTPRSYRFRPAINRRWAAIKRQIAATGADLLLHGGDLTRDGETHEFEYRQAREDLDSFLFPAFVHPWSITCQG